MESLLPKMQSDMRRAMKAQDTDSVNALKVIIGEFQRQPTKDLTYEEEIRILKRLEKNEMELLFSMGLNEISLYLQLIRMYLPEEVSPVLIEEWIKENIDFNNLKSPMQAIGIVMKAFNGRADGRMVKEIVSRLAR